MNMNQDCLDEIHYLLERADKPVTVPETELWNYIYPALYSWEDIRERSIYCPVDEFYEREFTFLLVVLASEGVQYP